MEYEEFSGKTVEDAITEACTKYTVTIDRLDYEVIEKGTTGFLGLNSKPAIIKARIKSETSEEKPDETDGSAAGNAADALQRRNSAGKRPRHIARQRRLDRAAGGDRPPVSGHA